MTIGPQFATRNELEQLRRKITPAISGKNLISVNEYDLIAPPIAFLNLTDVPVSYAAAGNWVVRVKSTVDALEFADLKGTTNQVTVTENAADFTLSLPQDIHTGASPTFVTAKLSALTDGYVPYHVSDAAGLANSVIRTDGTLVGVGMLPTVAQLEVNTSQIITSTTAAPYLKIVNLSNTERDPIIQFAVGATPVTKFTMGVDDSDSNKFKISLLDTLGAAGKDILTITSTGEVGGNKAAPEAWFHWVSTDDDLGKPNTIYEETRANYAVQLCFRTTARDWWVWNDSSPDTFGIEDRTYTLTNPYSLGVGEPKAILFDGGTQNLAFWKASTSSWGTSAVGVGMVGIVKTAPSTSPADAYQFWAADFGAGGTVCPFIRTEGGITVKLNQNVGTDGSPTFVALNLSATSNQIVLQSAGVTGTITATPASSNKVWTLQNVTGTIYQTAGTDVAVADGGTGLSSYAVGDLLYASAGTTLAGLADVAVGSYLASGGVTTAPLWATLNQAAVAGLTTADGPTWDHVHIVGGTDALFSTYRGANSDGYNIFIGGGGQSSVGEVGATYKGSYNISLGVNALLSNTTGYKNIAHGAGSLEANTTGFYNVGIGLNALLSNTAGSANTIIGVAGLKDLNITANDGSGANTAIGFNTGLGIVTGINNTILGANVGGLAAALSNNIILANGAGTIKAQHDNTNWSLTGNIYPAADNTYYLGKNDDDSPFAWKGVILKDTTNGKYYRIEVINGVVTPTDLTD